MASATASEPLVHFGVATKIVLKAGGDVLTLGNDGDAAGKVATDFVEKQRIVGASEDDGVDERILGKEFVDGVLDEVIGTRFVELVVLDQRHPHGAGLAHDGAFGIEFLYLQIVGTGKDGSLGGQHTDVVGVGKFSDHFGSRSDDTEHTAVGCMLGQVVLLDGTQGFGGGCVAAEDDERTTKLEKFLDGLQGELIHNIKRTRTIRCACVVAKIDVVVLRHALANAIKNGQTAIARIEDTNGTLLHVVRLIYLMPS